MSASRHRPIQGVVLGYVLFVSLVSRASAFHFYLHPQEKRCFSDSAPPMSKVLAAYTVSTGPGVMPVDLKVTMNNGKNVLLTQANIEHGKFAFVVPFSESDTLRNTQHLEVHRRRRPHRPPSGRWGADHRHGDESGTGHQYDGQTNGDHRFDGQTNADHRNADHQGNAGDRGGNMPHAPNEPNMPPLQHRRRRLLSDQDFHPGGNAHYADVHARPAVDPAQHMPPPHDGGYDPQHHENEGRGQYGSASLRSGSHRTQYQAGNEDAEDDLDDLDFENYEGVNDAKLDDEVARQEAQNMRTAGSFDSLADSEKESQLFDMRRFEVCLTNTEAKNGATHRRVSIAVNKGKMAHDYTQLAKAEHMQQLEVSLRAISEELAELMMELDRTRMMEDILRVLNEATSHRVLVMAVVSILSMFVVGGYQMFYTRKIFKRRKLM